jgi:hypothetical protein
MTSTHPDKLCPNCSSPLDGPYCSQCGQHQVDLDRPFRQIFSEGLSTFLAFDTRLVRTLWPLIRRPGFLTVEFLAGRRARYVHPFKLYFAFSLLFFFVFSFSTYSIVRVNEPGVVTIRTSDGTTTQESHAENPASSETQTSSGEPGSSVLDRFFQPLSELAENDPARLNRLFLDRLSKSLIILVPVFALVLQLLFWRTRYVAHLVFALHLHSFSFMILVAGAFVDLFAGSIGNSVATAAIAIYSYLALRRVYGQGRLVTLFKFVVLTLGYLVALLITMLGTLIVTVAAI